MILIYFVKKNISFTSKILSRFCSLKLNICEISYLFEIVYIHRCHNRESSFFVFFAICICIAKQLIIQDKNVIHFRAEADFILFKNFVIV